MFLSNYLPAPVISLPQSSSTSTSNSSSSTYSSCYPSPPVLILLQSSSSSTSTAAPASSCSRGPNERQKCAPLPHKCSKNAYPYAESRSRDGGRVWQPPAPGGPASVNNTHPQPKSVSKTCTLNPKVRPPDPGRRQKRVPSGKKCVKNAYPQPESPPPQTPAGVKNTYPQQKSVPKTRTLSPKLRPPDPGGRQKRVPSSKKCVKNAYPQPKNAPPIPRRVSKTRTLSQKVRQKHVPSARKSMHPFRK